MQEQIFSKLYREAKEYQSLDMYIGERGFEEWMEPYFNGSDAKNVVQILTDIYNMSKMNLSEQDVKMKLQDSGML